MTEPREISVLPGDSLTDICFAAWQTSCALAVPIKFTWKDIPVTVTPDADLWDVEENLRRAWRAKKP